MTTYSRSTLKTFFETGDVPFGQQYSDLVDSCLNIVDTTAQSIASPLIVTELIAPRVSATNASFTGIVSAGGNVFVDGYIRNTSGTVSAAGITQGTAASLIYAINKAAGVANGVTTGFAIPANNTGRTQVIYNDVASANLWPPTGGTINALAANAVFPMAASTPYAIYHIGASAYAVK